MSPEQSAGPAERSDTELLPIPLKVVNIGLPSLPTISPVPVCPSFKSRGLPQLGEIQRLRDRLETGCLRTTLAMQIVENGNREALNRMLPADPVLIDVVPAHTVIPALNQGRTLCMPARRSNGAGCAARCVARSAGAIVFEGWAEISKQRLRWPKRQRSRSIPTTTSMRSGR